MFLVQKCVYHEERLPSMTTIPPSAQAAFLSPEAQGSFAPYGALAKKPLPRQGAQKPTETGVYREPDVYEGDATTSTLENTIPGTPQQYAPGGTLQNSITNMIQGKQEKPKKPVVLGASVVGTLVPMAMLAAFGSETNLYKEIGENFDKTGWNKWLKKPAQALGTFCVNYEKPWRIFALGGSAVAAGYAGGMIRDKGEGGKEKAKEGVFQFVTNIFMPVAFCWGLKNGVDHFKKIKDAGIKEVTAPFLDVEENKFKIADNLNKILPKRSEEEIIDPSKLSNFGKFLEGYVEEGGKVVKGTKNIHKAMPAISAIGLSLAGIVAGVTTGAAVSNGINKMIDPEREKRKIKASDFAIQVDDLVAGFAVTGVLQRIPFVGPFIDKILPLVYGYSAYETGDKTKKPEKSQVAKLSKPSPMLTASDEMVTFI
jgi:hypothetical protein